MIYLVYEERGLIVETDNLEHLKKVVKLHPACTVRELGSDKVYRPRLARRSA